MVPLAAIMIYCLGANSKWIGARELRLHVVGLPVSSLGTAKLYECFDSEEAVLTSTSPETDFHLIEFVADSNANSLIAQLKVTGDDYLIDWFDRTKTADYILLEYEDPLSKQPQRAVFRTPSKSGVVTINCAPSKP